MVRNVSFGIYLSQLRLKNGFERITHLADAAGISKSTLSRIEAGKQDPDPETLKKLAHHLDTPYEVLMQVAGYLERPEVGVSAIPPEIDPLDLRILEMLKQLDSREKKLAEVIIENIKNSKQQQTAVGDSNVIDFPFGR